MLINSVVSSSYGVFGACQNTNFSISTQPLQDLLASPPCSTLRSSHSEILRTELLLHDLVADPCHAAQQKHPEHHNHGVGEHSASINGFKGESLVNGRRQATNSVRQRHIDSSGNTTLHDHLPPSVSKFPNVDNTQDIDINVSYRPSEQENETGHGGVLRAIREAQNIDEALNFIEGLADEPLSADIFIPILKKCSEQKALAPAKRLHLHVCKHGFETCGVLKKFLVTIYVDSGCIHEAERLVSQSDHVDQHPWSTLIQGYLESGDSKQAFKLYKEMDRKFVPSRRYILMDLLKTFASEQGLEECQELHAKIVERELESDRFFCNTLVDMYVKCECLVDAQEVFQEQSCKDIVLYSTLITGYNERGHFEDVLRCWDQLVLEGLDPDVPTVVCSLKACAGVQDLDKGYAVHTEGVKQMLEKEIMVGNCLVSMYAKCGALSDSQEVFDKLPVRDVVAWSALIAGYADHDFGVKALEQFGKMKMSGVIPNDVTFLSILKACVSIGAVEKGQEIHAEITAEEYENYPLVSSALVDMYSKFGLLSEARFLFDKLPVQNVVTWTALVEAYAEHGLHSRAFRCFHQMQSQGVLPNRVTFLCILKACCSRGSLEGGRDLHSEIIKRGYEGGSFIGSMLVDMYAKCGSPAEAQFMFKKLPSQCGISWTALIAGYAKHGRGEEVFDHFEQMKETQVLPETATYLYILNVCGDYKALDRGQLIHMEVVARGFENHDRISPAMMYMYAKNASLAEAQFVFDSLQSRDIASWHTLMGGFVEQGLSEAALGFLKRMEKEGVPPEVDTWILCMKACKCAGLVNKIYGIHVHIVKQGFETDPSVAHLILDTYAFHGLFEDSKAVFDRLPVSDSYKWIRSISHCS